MAAVKEFILFNAERALGDFSIAWNASLQQLPPVLPPHHQFHRHTITPLSESPPRGSYEAIAEFWRDDPDAPMVDWRVPLIEGISTSRSVHFLAEEHIIKEGRGPVKFMSLLRRKPGIDAAAFSRAWRIHHPLVVRSVAEIWRNFKGYRQNHILPGQCRHLDGTAVDVPFDGIVEIWFASRADLTATMMSERYREIIRPDEETFVDLPNIRMLATEEIVLAG